MEAQAILNSESCIKLKEHNQCMLTSNQWVLIEVIEFPPNHEPPIVVKVIGEDNGHSVSAPIEYWEKHQFCGIIYHTEAWCGRISTINQAMVIAERTGNQIAFYNPFSNIVKIIE